MRLCSADLVLVPTSWWTLCGGQQRVSFYWKSCLRLSDGPSEHGSCVGNTTFSHACMATGIFASTFLTVNGPTERGFIATHIAHCCASHAVYTMQEVYGSYSPLQKSRTMGSELQRG